MLDRKAPQRDKQFLSRAPDLYIEIYQSQARADAAGRQWEKVIHNLLAIRELDTTLLGWWTGDEARKQQLLAEVNRQLAQAYQDMGSDRLDAQRWGEAIDSFQRAISLAKSRARELNPQLVRAYRERASDHANHREFPEADRDLAQALDLDKYSPENCRACGLLYRKMAIDARARGQVADEEKLWDFAIRCLNWAIRLDPELKGDLQRPLEEAQRGKSLLNARLPSTSTSAS